MEKSAQLKQWIEQGASIYICGSLKGMAQGVETVLIDILGEDQFEQLIEQKRYLRDVY
ncbi:Sulfite reductase [NADPH] flavoprotein alpha-component [compost metagenome]